MLFAYAGELATEEDAARFVAENGIQTGICFGPVMVDGGVNVCPAYYGIGDYGGELARCAIGQVDELHYLVTAVDYYYSVSELADELITRGVRAAYNIDGGQSSAIIFRNQQINPSVFGAERAQSDCIFFATALIFAFATSGRIASSRDISAGVIAWIASKFDERSSSHHSTPPPTATHLTPTLMAWRSTPAGALPITVCLSMRPSPVTIREASLAKASKFAIPSISSIPD
jgi:hypothetical protein